VLHGLPKLGGPAPIGRAERGALLLGAGLPYLYDRGRVALGFVQGLTLAALFAFAAQLLWPAPIGLHLALPLFCAAYAWDTRSVFWRYSAPVLAAYAVLLPAWLGGRGELLPHALAGLFAWALNRLLPGGPGAETEAESDEPSPSSSTLGLRD